MDHSDPLRESLLVAEQRLRLIHDHQEALLIDGHTGRVIWPKIGDAMRVRFDTFELRTTIGNVQTHYHPVGELIPIEDPRSSGNSFSPADISPFFVSGLAELWTVTARFTYGARPPVVNDVSPGAQAFRGHVATMSFERLLDSVRNHAQWVEQRLLARIADTSDPLTGAEAEALLYHFMMIELADSWDLQYVRDEVIE